MNNRIFLIATIAAVIAAIAWRYWSPAQNAGAPSSGKPLVQVSVPPLSGLAQEGEAAFNASCASCHGANAAGVDGVAPPLVHIIYEPGHHADAAFYLAAKRGVRAHHWSFGNMPAVEGVNDTDIGRIVAYVRALQRANGIQ